jgi:hypothetical protein
LVPDVFVGWRDVFEVGKAAIRFYIGKQGLKSTYGAAASIVVVLIWVYYTSQIILMGAEVTHSYARHKGSIKQRGSQNGVSKSAPSSQPGSKISQNAARSRNPVAASETSYGFAIALRAPGRGVIEDKETHRRISSQVLFIARYFI